MKTYDAGDALTAAVTFQTDADPPVPTDPGNVTLTVRAPAGTTTEYLIGELGHPSAGRFTKVLVPSVPGVWVARWVGSDGLTQTVEETFAVRPLAVEGFLLGYYGDDPDASPRDQLRLLIGDTNNDDVILTDRALDHLLTTTGKDGKPTTTTVVRAFHAMAARYARLVDGATGDISRSYSQRSATFRAMAEAVRADADLERQAADADRTAIPPMILAGGMAGDPYFAVGMFDGLGTRLGDGGYDPRAIY